MTSPQTLAAVRMPVRRMESVLASRWARLAIPSFSDLFFVAILVLLFLSTGAAGWQSLLADGDVGWHIRSGEYILAHHAVPRHDLYSFSKPNAPWYAWEWLTDLLDAALFRMAGLKGIVLMAAVVIAVFATTLILRMVRGRVHLFVGMIAALLAVGASMIHFLARPHLFTLLLLSVSMWMLESDRERPSRRIWWLVPLTVVWTNLHGGFLALIAVLGLAAAGAAGEAWLGRAGWANARRYTWLTAACAGATLINPYGYGLHRHILTYLRSDWIRNAVQEFQSPSFRGENMIQFEALLFAGLIACGFLFRRVRIVEGLWIVFFAQMALGSARHVPLYVTVAAPPIAAEIGEWWSRWTSGLDKKSLIGIVNAMAADAMAGFRRASAWPAIVVGALILIRAPIPWPTDFPAEMFPVVMVHAHAAEIFSSRVLTTDQWGDYLIYANPKQPVFIDGRSDFYGPEIGTQYLHMANGQWDWEPLMLKYGFNLALLPIDIPLSQLLKRSPAWRIVEDDGKRILLVRRPMPAPATGNSSPGTEVLRRQALMSPGLMKTTDAAEIVLGGNR